MCKLFGSNKVATFLYFTDIVVVIQLICSSPRKMTVITEPSACLTCIGIDSAFAAQVVRE